MSRRWRRRHGRRGRLPKPVTLDRTPSIEGFVLIPRRGSEPIYIEPAELEAFRLVDLESLS